MWADFVEADIRDCTGGCTRCLRVHATVGIGVVDCRLRESMWPETPACAFTDAGSTDWAVLATAEVVEAGLTSDFFGKLAAVLCTFAKRGG